jgi:transcriptional regulator with XRE-family HTH domain
VAGLRREEVSLLAGISVEYYTRLERGNARGVSDEVLGGWCETSRLNRAIGHPARHCRQISRLSATRPV